MSHSQAMPEAKDKPRAVDAVVEQHKISETAAAQGENASEMSQQRLTDTPFPKDSASEAATPPPPSPLKLASNLQVPPFVAPTGMRFSTDVDFVPSGARCGPMHFTAAETATDTRAATPTALERRRRAP
ncbi:hypothetical protein JX266_003086 [Neoarthrinium moseri]|nr:hypothetical protein JX266_003086 [Neoarthrinium moseri]